MIFILIGPSDEVLDPLVQKAFKEPDHLKVGPGQWLVFVDDSPTSKEVWEKLVVGDQEPPRGILFPIANGYFGLAPSSVWEWIAAKRQVAALI